MAIPEDLRAVKAGRFYWRASAHPVAILAATVLIVGIAAFFLPKLRRDTGLAAFIPRDHPAVRFRAAVTEIFGLSDPLYIVIVDTSPSGIFNSNTLQVVKWLTDQIEVLPGVNPERIYSLATTAHLAGTLEGVVVTSLLEPLPRTQSDVEGVRRRVMGSGIYRGRLVADDGRATAIVIGLSDGPEGTLVYRRVLALADVARSEAREIHVAGEAAVAAYLGTYIDTDAKRLYPLAAAAITFVLLLSYRTWGGVLLPNLIVAAAIALALGAMAGAGVSFYVITNALPVILFAIGVSETLHILGQYYEELERHPLAPPRELVTRVMCRMWRPVFLTSTADVTGFLALGFTSPLPAVTAFGLYASLGAAAILLLSLFTIPSLLIVLPHRFVGFYKAGTLHFSGGAAADWFGRTMAAIGHLVTHRPIPVLILGMVVVGVAGYGALRVTVDEDRIENFRRTEAIYLADQAINRTLSGSTGLEIVVSGVSDNDLAEPRHLQQIEELQRFLEALPHVKVTTSVVDFLKEVNRAFEDDRPEAYRIPDTADLVSQYLLFLATSRQFVNLNEYIDGDNRLANIRVTLDSGRYTEIKSILESIDRYLQQQFTGGALTAVVTGRPVVDHAWLQHLAQSTINGVALALFSVWLMASIGLHSGVAGLLAIVPVSMAILVNYGVMGFGDVALGIGTSMFAAISVGTAVNPAIHIIERLQVLSGTKGVGMSQALRTLFLTTGRGLFFDGLAVALGFGVLLTSQVPPLVWFGMLVSVCVLTGFIVSVTLLPALIVVFKPSFLYAPGRGAPGVLEQVSR